jgi:hypothetical protein
MKAHDHAVLEVCVSGSRAIGMALRLLWTGLVAVVRRRTVTFVVEED